MRHQITMQRTFEPRSHRHFHQGQGRWASFFGAPSTARAVEVLVLVFLVLAALASVLLYWRFVTYNLPASSHVDERRGLGVLLRFHEGSLDPGFFYYPTLLYYIVYAVGELLGGPHLFLLVGRAVTLFAGAALSIATFWLVRLITQSHGAALFAALLLLWNPVFAESASYMSTDLPTALFVTIALGCYLKAIRDASAAAWVLAFVFAGLATSAKYNAAILVLALMLADVLRATPAFATGSRTAAVLNSSLPPALLRAILMVIGGGLMLAAALTPIEFFVGMLRRSAELNSVVDAADIAFIRGKLRLIILAGSLASAYAALSVLRPSLLDPVRPFRVFAGPVMALLTFVLTTPFAVLSFTNSCMTSARS